jgi:hypothetical protein
MTKTIAAVPESFTQAQYTSLFEAVGLESKDVRRLEFRPDGVYAEVFERDEHGHMRFDKERDEPVVNKVFIPVRDD